MVSSVTPMVVRSASVWHHRPNARSWCVTFTALMVMRSMILVRIYIVPIRKVICTYIQLHECVTDNRALFGPWRLRMTCIDTCYQVVTYVSAASSKLSASLSCVLWFASTAFNETQWDVRYCCLIWMKIVSTSVNTGRIAPSSCLTYSSFTAVSLCGGTGDSWRHLQPRETVSQVLWERLHQGHQWLRHVHVSWGTTQWNTR